MALTRYTLELPDYVVAPTRYLPKSLEVLYALHLIRKPYKTRTGEMLHSADVESLGQAFGDAMGLYVYLWDIYKLQEKLTHLVYDTPISRLDCLGHPHTRAVDIRTLIHEKVLRATLSNGTGSPYLVASKTITNLLRLIDAGPLPRLTNTDKLE